MAFNQVPIMANQVESQRIGHQAISLTNFDNALEPAIAQGSVCEVGAALYEADADEPIAGLAAIAADNQVYIMLTVAGAAVTASGTIVAPTWDDSKQGFYSGAARAIGGLYKDAAGDYVNKWLYEFIGVAPIKLFGDGTVGVWDGIGFRATKELEIGDWDMTVTHSVSLAHGLSPAVIRNVRVAIIDDIEANEFFDTAPTLNPANGLLVGAEVNLSANVQAANIVIVRLAGGLFDSAQFDATPFNRGWVTIEYEV